MSYVDRERAPGPKRLLALDGGGIRGALTLEILAALEEMLREETGAGESFVLGDWFDYIAGTSTGAIIAAGLSFGKSVQAIKDLYETLGQNMFRKQILPRRFWYRYRADMLTATLKRELGEHTTFGDPRLRTLLMMVLRNASTDSPWPLSNNPGAKYNQAHRADNNLLLPLWQLVRASTAAPTFFPPEVVNIGPHDFVFVDGGVTMYNNPAFQLFLMATLDVYGLGWSAGEDEMLLVSVGTGTSPKANENLQPGDMNLLFNAASVPAALMGAALNEQDLLCRVFGRCRHGAQLDREVGDLRTGPGILDRRMFTYVRYNAELTRSGLDELGLTEIQPENVQRMDSVAHIGDLQRVGVQAARAVRREHFTGFLGQPQHPVASP